MIDTLRFSLFGAVSIKASSRDAETQTDLGDCEEEKKKMLTRVFVLTAEEKELWSAAEYSPHKGAEAKTIRITS